MTKGGKLVKRLTWDMATLCSHLETLRNVAMEALDSGVDTAISNPDLQTSVERGTVEALTLDAFT